MHPETHPLTQHLGDIILEALNSNTSFISAALPLKILPPYFNRYENGETFGFHVDNAIRWVQGTNTRIRTDLSCTVFLSEPEEYEGGELVVEDTYGYHEVKLPAGDLILYPSTSVHEVSPVTSGCRIGSFFWLQSMIRDDRGFCHRLPNGRIQTSHSIGDQSIPIPLHIVSAVQCFRSAYVQDRQFSFGGGPSDYDSLL